MESQVWPMSVLTVALPVLRVPQFVLTGPDHRRERPRRAVSSSSAPSGKNTTAAKAALPTPAHAGERTLSGTVPGGISCGVGSRPGDARRVMYLVASGTDTHAFKHSHTALDGHRMAHSTGCRDVWLLPALVSCNETTPRYAHTHTHLHCARRSLHASVPQFVVVAAVGHSTATTPRLRSARVGCSCYARRRRAAWPIASAAARCAARVRRFARARDAS